MQILDHPAGKRKSNTHRTSSIFGSRYRRYRFPHAGSSHGLPGSSLLRADWIGDRDLRPAWISPDSATGRPPDQRRHLLYATNRDQNITAPCQTAMPHNRGENEQAGSSVGFAHFTPLWGISGITFTYLVCTTMADLRDEVEEEFRDGMESARIRSHRVGIFRALQVGVAVVAAWLSPVPWWAKLVIFAVIIGVVVQYREIARIHRND